MPLKFVVEICCLGVLYFLKAIVVYEFEYCCDSIPTANKILSRASVPEYEYRG